MNKVLKEYPDDRIERSSVLHILGDIYKLREDYETALKYYKESLDFEQIFPNVITTSYLDFSELVVRIRKLNLFEFTETLLESKRVGQIFPLAIYKMCSILSVINQVNNNPEKAKYYGDLAEQNATLETSGLRYHKYLGIVTKREIWLDRLVKKIK